MWRPIFREYQKFFLIFCNLYLTFAPPGETLRSLWGATTGRVSRTILQTSTPHRRNPLVFVGAPIVRPAPRKAVISSEKRYGPVGAGYDPPGRSASQSYTLSRRKGIPLLFCTFWPAQPGPKPLESGSGLRTFKGGRPVKVTTSYVTTSQSPNPATLSLG